MNYALSTPALNGETITQGHSDYCAANGHGTYKIDGVDQGMCPRCGTFTTTTPALTDEDVATFTKAEHHRFQVRATRSTITLQPTNTAGYIAEGRLTALARNTAAYDAIVDGMDVDTLKAYGEWRKTN